MGGPADVRGVGIEGALLLGLPTHTDGRGSLSEVFRRAWVPGAREVVQANLSVSRPGVLRGLHFHRRQADYWCFLAGPAFVGLYDLRRGSPTEGRKAELLLDPAEGLRALYLPPGVAHGFYAVGEVRLLYLVDAYFTGEDEHGLAWDDPAVGISWPSREPVLSDRDREGPPLAEARAAAPSWRGSPG
ncbi:MAG TPA: dTDP-4-dehydrorhamnose 3,5-epimerase family protein [Actinomycetota bacterium]|nr:dTDP-4-dehydrorhamnose 3,5-epimerase family protein [Actinomycetota bacterium]